MDQQQEVKKSVFLADDNSTLSSVWERALRAEGFTVYKADNGQDAVKQILEKEVPIIFSDFNMPGLTGLQLLDAIKKQKKHFCVNIITGFATLEGAVEAMRNGACDYLSKPFGNDELAAMAYRCLRHQEGHKETDVLKKTITNLEEVNRLKSEFVSNVSHELRTPLFAMGSALDLALEDILPLINDGTKNLIHIIQSNHARLTDVIQNLLNFSQIEKGRFIPKMKKMNMNELIQNILKDLSPLAGKKDIQMMFEAVQKEIIFEADINQMRQILINLIGNAIKFAPPSGLLKVSLDQNGDTVNFSVWDNGQGIPASSLERIFDRFYQVDGSLTREVGGTGIGLSIVKAIVDMHGGRIWAESKEGEFTRLNVSLPKSHSSLTEEK